MYMDGYVCVYLGYACVCMCVGLYAGMSVRMHVYNTVCRYVYMYL